MTQRGEEQTRQIHDGLACPTCQYSLRGLPGDDVTCPECGGRINIPELVASKWTGPWYAAPLYNMLALPLAWGLVATFAALFGLAIAQRGDPTLEAFGAAMAAIFLGWILAMWLVSKRFGGVEGFALAMLLHFCLPAYIFGIAGGVGFGIKTAFDVSSNRMTLLFYDVAMIAVCIGAIVAGRLIERFVARRCIRRYLQRRTGGASHAAWTSSKPEP